MTRAPGSGSPDMSGLTLDDKAHLAVGGATAKALEKAFGIVTVADLLSHYPRRYISRGQLTLMSEIPRDEPVSIVAEVKTVRERKMASRRGSILEVSITDGLGYLTLTFFNQAWRAAQLPPGARGIFAGKVSDYRGGLQLTHPTYELFDSIELDPSSPEAVRFRDQPIPIYPATASLPSGAIKKAIEITLELLRPIEDPVPDSVRAEEGLIPLADAYRLIHSPEKKSDWKAAHNTLRFHEAFVLQAALVQQRRASMAQRATPRVPKPGGLLEQFDQQLAFTLTGDQKFVGSEIAADLAKPSPMNRLVQGEVGSGKTLVALRAMLAVADSGGQSALLAPTEVLAAQHVRSIAKSLGPELSARIMPTLVTGQLSTAERKRALLATVSGNAQIAIGTHALLGDAVSFFDLGLVVVDEQHRFGVEQRETLRQKGTNPPHVLVLTATPIPRTVAMTVFGDLDVSTISELPAGRPGIESFAVPLADRPGWEARIWTRLLEEHAKGRQAFIVCPAIDDTTIEDDSAAVDASDSVNAASASAGDPAAPKRATASVERTMAQIAANPALAGLRVSALHGRMKSDEKDAIMRAFAAREIDVLVATTVIEVGVDVPNASMMIVLDADRFGVSQLHQLRGRVGRGSVPGLCLLVSYAEEGSVSRQRIEAVAATLDGFELAQVDLELRREGNVLGGAQSGGRSSLRLLRVAHDGEVISNAREHVGFLLDSDPTLASHPALAAALERRLREAERRFLVKN